MFNDSLNSQLTRIIFDTNLRHRSHSVRAGLDCCRSTIVRGNAELLIAWKRVQEFRYSSLPSHFDTENRPLKLCPPAARTYPLNSSIIIKLSNRIREGGEGEEEGEQLWMNRDNSRRRTSNRKTENRYFLRHSFVKKTTYTSQLYKLCVPTISIEYLKWWTGIEFIEQSVTSDYRISGGSSLKITLDLSLKRSVREENSWSL